MKKKITLAVLSMVTVVTLIGGTVVYASSNEMSKMMNGNMENRMKAMNSSEGKQMTATCTDFMKKYQDNDQNQ